MEFKERLEQAIDYAVSSDYDAWFRGSRILERLKQCDEVCLFGAGKFFEDIRRTGYFDLHMKVNIRYVCDNDKSRHGSRIRTDIEDAVIISWEELLELEHPIVVVTVGNPRELLEELKKHGIESYAFGELTANVFTEHFPGTYFAEQRQRIMQAFELLSDLRSQEIYTEVFCNRVAPHLAEKSFVELQEENEYFETGLFPIIPEQEYIVECGAYIGDSLERYMELFHNTVGAYYCLELNPDIADICQRKIEEYHNDHIHLIRAGVSDRNQTIQLARSGLHMANQYRTSQKTTEARLMRLDDMFQGEPVTYIKMDIEGAEMAALRGAEKIIGNKKPKLGISAYHILSDLWEIPLLIQQYCGQYKIFYRHHSPIVWDTNCYAVVDEVREG